MSSGIKKINFLNNCLDIGPIIGNIIIDKNVSYTLKESQ